VDTLAIAATLEADFLVTQDSLAKLDNKAKAVFQDLADTLEAEYLDSQAIVVAA